MDVNRAGYHPNSFPEGVSASCPGSEGFEFHEDGVVAIKEEVGGAKRPPPVPPCDPTAGRRHS